MEEDLVQKYLDYLIEEAIKDPPKRRLNQIDHVPEGFKIWESRLGSRYVARVTGCLFCKNCTDILIDSQGPYMLTCSKGLDTYFGMSGECESFVEEDE